LRRLVNLNVAVQRGLAAAEGIFDALDVPVEQETGQRRIERVEGRVEYHSVSFRYSASEKPALKDVTLTVPAGSSVAIVGHSGSGKSTLVSLLPRFYDATSGAVCLDGVDVRDYRLADLRRQLSLVSQDALLFDDTIANNIAYGALANRSRAAIEEAAHAAYVDEFSEQLPAGLDTPVGERGVLLSGGQRQRIVIARALLKDAPVLILDEATSALDTESEQIVQRALQALMQGRTTLIVAHRLSTVQQADQIVVLKDGVVVEIGKHSELIALGQHYASLYQSSFAD
jgi:ATP-binding cassette, subfamily B, bacterial MsbA